MKIILTCESTTKMVMTAETCMDHEAERGSVLPEDLGVEAATMLLEEIRKGGCVDTASQSLALLLMCLCPEDVSRIRIGSISRYTIASLRLFKAVFGVTMKVTADKDSKTVLLSCLGTGFKNWSKKVT